MASVTDWVRRALTELGPDVPDAKVKAYIREKAPDVPEGHVSLVLRRLRGGVIPTRMRHTPGESKNKKSGETAGEN